MVMINAIIRSNATRTTGSSILSPVEQ